MAARAVAPDAGVPAERVLAMVREAGDVRLARAALRASHQFRLSNEASYDRQN
jgi:hypothetical protein